MIRCKDESLYTGVTIDVERRYWEHQSGSPKAAKYTKSRGVKCLEKSFTCKNKNEAYKAEYQFKRLSKTKKEEFLKSGKQIDTLFK